MKEITTVELGKRVIGSLWCAAGLIEVGHSLRRENPPQGARVWRYRFRQLPEETIEIWRSGTQWVAQFRANSAYVTYRFSVRPWWREIRLAFAVDEMRKHF
ncbi:MAG TPA: hypothetical protein PK409_08810 [Thermosynergistes sp.]|jgi:hypothetical protein|nr:hypothetical protein [Thermosynergistes sp.]HQE22018.1 hypothetical protein [Thermosynergistes sp.]